MIGAHALANGGLAPGAEQVKAGALETVKLAGDDVMLREPSTFDQWNIDRFNS